MLVMRSVLARFWKFLRSRSSVPLGIVAAFFFLSGIAYMRAFDYSMEAGSTEEFCVSCHTMKDNVYPAYTESIHYSNRSGVRASCADCHVPHRWSDKVVRKIIATKEIWGQIRGTIDTPEKFAAHRLALARREWKRFEKSDSLECRNCHDQSYFAYEKQGAPGTFMHSKMIETGGFTCIDCHKGIAHVLPEVDELARISPSVLEPLFRAPFEHGKMTLEETE